MLNEKELENKLVEAIKIAETKLTADTVKALEEALEKEDNEVAKVQLEAILKNVKIAREDTSPICQDTGIQTFFIYLGYDFPFAKSLKKIIENAVRRATVEVPIRPNTIDLLSGKNQKDNTGRFIPYITWELVEGDGAEIIIFPKGGGSENMSALFMLKPGEGMKGIKKVIIDQIISAGGKPCPPTIVGIGLGGGADLSLKLAKKSLLREVGIRHENPEIAKLEKDLLKAINKLGVGPMGLGGRTTVLDIHIEYAHRHPASLPVGIVFQCWANRRAKIHINKDGVVEVK